MKNKLMKTALELFYEENKRLKKEIKRLKIEVANWRTSLTEDLPEGLFASGEPSKVTKEPDSLGITADGVIIRDNYEGKLYYFDKTECGSLDEVNISACSNPDIFNEDKDYSRLYADLANCKRAHTKWVEENL